MRSSRCVDQLCLLPQSVSTTGSPEIEKRSVVSFFSPLTVSFSSHSHALSLLFVFHFLLFPFLYLFFFFSFSTFYFLFFLLSFLSPLTHRIFFSFLQVRGTFLSLYYSSCHVSHFPWSMCHMDTCSRWHSPHHMTLIPCVLLPWFHVATPIHSMWHHPMCHPTPDISKNVKF